MATDYNISSDTAISTLSPITGDRFFVYNGATLTLDISFSALQIIIGDTKTGAASAGQKYGIVTANAGITITWDGNATANNSGIKMSPTTPGVESKNSVLNINGTAENPVVFTNSQGANNTNFKYTINNLYGSVNGDYLTCNNFWTAIFSAITGLSANSSSNHKLTNIVAGPVGGSANLITIVAAAGISLQFDFRFSSVTSNTGYTVTLVYTASGITTGGKIDLSGFTGINSGGSASNISPVNQAITGTLTRYYVEQCLLDFVDIRPTKIIPLDLSFVDLKDGTIKATISNIASYRTQGTDGIEDYRQL